MEKDRGKAEGTRTITTSEFKAKCLKLIDEVAASGNEVVITKNRASVLAADSLPTQAESPIRP